MKFKIQIIDFNYLWYIKGLWAQINSSGSLIVLFFSPVHPKLCHNIFLFFNYLSSLIQSFTLWMTSYLYFQPTFLLIYSSVFSAACRSSPFMTFNVVSGSPSLWFFILPILPPLTLRPPPTKKIHTTLLSKEAILLPIAG